MRRTKDPIPTFVDSRGVRYGYSNATRNGGLLRMSPRPVDLKRDERRRRKGYTTRKDLRNILRDRSRATFVQHSNPAGVTA